MVFTAASVATKLPWTQIIASLPTVVATAQRLWQGWRAAPEPKPIDPGASLETQILALDERIEALQINEKAQAEVVSQIAEQLQGLATGLVRLRQLVIATSVIFLALLVALGALVSLRL